MYSKDEFIAYLKIHFPNTDSKVLSERLGLSLDAVRALANRNGIHKSKEYLGKLYIELMKKNKKSQR